MNSLIFLLALLMSFSLFAHEQTLVCTPSTPTSSSDFSNGGEVAGANRTLGNTDDYEMGFLSGGIDMLSVGKVSDLWPIYDAVTINGPPGQTEGKIEIINPGDNVNTGYVPTTLSLMNLRYSSASFKNCTQTPGPTFGWTNLKPEVGCTYLEQGYEGITFHTVPKGDVSDGTNPHEHFQITSNGIGGASWADPNEAYLILGLPQTTIVDASTDYNKNLAGRPYRHDTYQIDQALAPLDKVTAVNSNVTGAWQEYFKGRGANIANPVPAAIGDTALVKNFKYWNPTAQAEGLGGQLKFSVDSTNGDHQGYALQYRTTRTGVSGLKTSFEVSSSGVINLSGGGVDIDACTADLQGSFWWDSVDSRFEFCNSSSGVPGTW